ncbi:AAA family ATPase [Bradyrhizobium sp. MOS001]|uniref:AAA family ATPase n=1 Tax=Bradyrhizobium sp. MOS001 TaxID=2133948 RepID=UPI001432038A|nr:AAA family ATPase [Bradyrhizobium sp. MOS001]
MMSDGNRLPLSELLRPQQLHDLTLSDHAIRRLQQMLDSRLPLNMVFHGPPGSGKTSAAKIFLTGWPGFDLMQINGAMDAGIDTIRDQLSGFARSPFSDSEHVKLCFIDEADHLTKSAQASLRVLIERCSDKCRFIFAANEIGKLEQPLRSRLKAVDFTIRFANKDKAQDRYIGNIAGKLGELGIKFNRERLDRIVSVYFPDLRTIANEIEFEFGLGNSVPATDAA